jgi:hypothetical protein
VGVEFTRRLAGPWHVSCCRCAEDLTQPDSQRCSAAARLTLRLSVADVAGRVPHQHDQLQHRDKLPVVLLVDIGTSSVDYELSTWTNETWKTRVDSSRLRAAIWWAFKEKRITIAFPQIDVHFDPPVTASHSGIRQAA